ncbi:MAG TPA: dihydropteroate synthase [Burkholderiaceae bacterium]|nr:dihydropteroate synthase [Burkholderiaceae bacterium]
MGNTLQCGRFKLSLERPLIMGIVNVTPDSFSTGSSDFRIQDAIDLAFRLIEQGADMLDIGGESTRPGADPVPEDEERRRVVPVLKALRDCGLPLSVDTFKPGVMRVALDEGADMINDITAFRDPQALQLVAGSECGLCVMHMQGEPRTMQQAPQYNDVVADVRHFLQQRCEALLQAGVQPNRITIDPGLGFGKTVAQNYQLLRNLEGVQVNGLPWLLGVSRKSMIGHITGRTEPRDRVAGSIAAALAGVARGVKIVRVHDVKETRDALRVWQAVEYGVEQ